MLCILFTECSYMNVFNWQFYRETILLLYNVIANIYAAKIYIWCITRIGFG